ncbi:MAG: type I glutamate--ammonia ligase [Candidatus Thermoplasmatota archaeon]|jgi:glutamine synthetase|nr:type I glutamate--ammonia ligase [Candidatus Thermoplasmatota archaeon]MCL5964035.1 type I glutamate--ammonia ligase [Candidatus Thermoplasmatota archaeon]
MVLKTKSKESCIQTIKGNKIRWIDLQFTDIDSRFHHVTVPARTVNDSFFDEGIGKLDGSSIKGLKPIFDSDMVLKPVISSFSILPWYDGDDKTARFICTIFDNGHRYPHDTRFIAEKSENHATELGYTKTYWGPELEFFVFNKLSLEPSPQIALTSGALYGVSIKSDEAPWNDSDPYWFNKTREGYYVAPPADTLVDYRNRVSRIIEDSFDIEIEAHHHEVAAAGQCEINIKYDTLTTQADNVVTIKYVSRIVANSMNKIVTYMPKPIFGDNASGMHIHQSLWKDDKNIFYDPKDAYSQISQECRYYIGGLMSHASALCAFTNPTTNSYRRLIPGYEAPIFIAWSKGNRSANIRIPRYVKNSEVATRIEYRTPDPSANIYLAEASILMAGLDGIKHKIEPPMNIDEDIYKIDVDKRKKLNIMELPKSLRESIESLDSDNEFLKPVFDNSFINFYKEIKIKEDIENSIRPTPYEFYQYMDI